MVGIVKIIGYLFFLPLCLVADIFRADKSTVKKLWYILLVILIFGSASYSMMARLFDMAKIRLYQAGYINILTDVRVSGTSMLPSIQDGELINVSNPNKYGISRGDIVSFKNLETGGKYYLKRIVGLPGETVMIKQGQVQINGKPILENYTYQNLPTYGNTFLGECEVKTIPPSSYMLLGDNRTVSQDSRVVGFIEKTSIEGVIKTGLSDVFGSYDYGGVAMDKKIKSDEFLKLINEERAKNGLGPLVTYKLINDLAIRRAGVIGSNYENWKQELRPIDNELKSSGYRYNKVHEYVTFGYLDSKDVVEQIIQSVFEKEAFLSSNYMEVGIGISERTYKECKTPVISVILSWPSVPTYDSEVISGWEKEAEDGKKIMTVLQTYVGVSGYDQGELRSLINTVAGEVEISTRIATKMRAKEWLTEKDNQDINEYHRTVDDVLLRLKKFMG